MMKCVVGCTEWTGVKLERNLECLSSNTTKDMLNSQLILSRLEIRDLNGSNTALPDWQICDEETCKCESDVSYNLMVLYENV